ncbi:hypothetical protein F0169_24750 [Pseudomonas sp. MAFF 212408]|uniref:Uncharacterized protein n=1 Tax=Pseudomonas kitaguniensis TaxID=2607908 RepID=A0A5N7KS73_9PSED|nr:hypothetical protein [Pseudomonas kitaguniensis]
MYLRYLGDGLYRFRIYSESLLIEPEAGPVKSNQTALAPPLAYTADLLSVGALARDAGTSVYEAHRVDAIASKPAPTVDCILLGRLGQLSGRLLLIVILIYQK